MMLATVVKTIEAFAKPWATLYSDSTAISSAVTFFHLGGLLFAGGLAISSDRLTFRALRGSPEERDRLLHELANSHMWVLRGLTVIFASGILLVLSDVKTFAYSGIYWTKMGLVVLLLANGAVLQRTEQKLRSVSLLSDSAPAVQRLWTRLRYSASASMILWTAILLAGVVLVESS